MTETSTTDRIAQLTATRDKLVATANEPNLPLTRDRALRMATYLTTQIAELGGTAVCGICELATATQTVQIPDTDDVQACLTCGTMLRAFL